MSTMLTVVLAAVLSGCSNQVFYKRIEARRKKDGRELPHTQYEKGDK